MNNLKSPTRPADLSFEITARQPTIQASFIRYPLFLTRLSSTERNPGAFKPLSESHDAVIRVYDDVGNVIETHQH